MMIADVVIIKEEYDVTNYQNVFDYSEPFIAHVLFFDKTASSMNLSDNIESFKARRTLNESIYKAPNDVTHYAKKVDTLNNWWAMLALVLVLGTAAGNILVCLAIAWERRLQNVTNYFLMSLAITDFMVAILVMPLGILTLVRGYFPLSPVYCLVWICLDVLLCTSSIMHLCTISLDRYLSLRYPMKFGRNKTRRRVTLKILFVWLLSIAMSLPLCLMYSKDDDSVLVDGTCHIPDPLYKLIGSIICFFIPLGVMLITYALTVKLLAKKRENISVESSELNRRYIWKKLLVNKSSEASTGETPVHTCSAASTDTEFTTLDTHDLWMPESEPAPPSATSALQEFGAEILKLSRGLEGIRTNVSGDESLINTTRSTQDQYSLYQNNVPTQYQATFDNNGSRTSLGVVTTKNEHLLPLTTPCTFNQRAATYNEVHCLQRVNNAPLRKRSFSFHEQTVLSKLSSSGKSFSIQQLPREKRDETLKVDERITHSSLYTLSYSNENKEISFSDATTITTKPSMKNIDIGLYSSKSDQGENRFPYKSCTVVTWRSGKSGSRIGNTKTLVASSKSMPLRRAATMRAHNCATINLASKGGNSNNNTCSPSIKKYTGSIRIIPHSLSSSTISKDSSRHGRIIRLEQKATKVLGVVFFTFVILWAPFFILNLTPAICPDCEKKINHKIFDFVTWLGYASSMVNPIFYTIFNKVFRQAFKKVILCQYGTLAWRPSS